LDETKGASEMREPDPRMDALLAQIYGGEDGRGIAGIGDRPTPGIKPRPAPVFKPAMSPADLVAPAEVVAVDSMPWAAMGKGILGKVGGVAGGVAADMLLNPSETDVSADIPEISAADVDALLSKLEAEQKAKAVKEPKPEPVQKPKNMESFITMEMLRKASKGARKKLREIDKEVRRSTPVSDMDQRIDAREKMRQEEAAKMYKHLPGKGRIRLP
jgi:hypothetical protein